MSDRLPAGVRAGEATHVVEIVVATPWSVVDRVFAASEEHAASLAAGIVAADPHASARWSRLVSAGSR